ncbi:hypothetical protein OTERR_08620 [Oryzomicrobium terrae]|uniref:Uncharacterized protein n=1 Tax=Oryzomicrobium terrae TaxID=1735038 RepID=A0A5C1E7Z0_9RHOO|nr:hypothetical protein [Oryzomicrobium terrae]QEL64338.1 hypothetical protein OTERR_08620 [Oryzomicrobium terrae]
MHKDYEEVCKALDELAAVIKNGWSGDQTFCEAWGWNCPSVTRHDMAGLASKLAQDIRNSKPDTVSPALQTFIADIPRRLQLLRNQTVPQFWGGNNGPAVSAYTATLSSLRESLMPVIGWQLIPDIKVMPGHLARRLRSIQAELDQLLPNKEKVATQLAEIDSAHAAAESLPLDLKALADAREATLASAAQATASSEKAQTCAKDGEGELVKLKLMSDEAKKLVAQCEEAYRITTTKGLAAAFDQRAILLARSMWVWVIGLLGALAAGTYLGAERFRLLSQALASPETPWGHLFLQFLLSGLAVAAPVWFAWVATKQIGQRFRLAEDYGFKASVAKAYEGYRREAARIDEEFEYRLFGSALTRLEEPPLRLVEAENHGSPWGEFTSSPAFKAALEKMPDLRATFDKIFKRAQQGKSSSKDESIESMKKAHADA